MSQPMPGRNTEPVRLLYEEMFSRGRYELIDQVFHSGCPVHFGSRHVRLNDAVLEGKGWRSAAPNLSMTIEDIREQGDTVHVTWSSKATHTGHGHGFKPTGRMIVLRGKSRFRILNGKIVEAWNEEYRPELLRQIGVSKPRMFMLLLVLNVWSAIRGVIMSLTA